MRRQSGFTLLELMVALVVFGLLMAGVAQTMRFGMTAWTAETRAADGSETLAAVDGALRRLIEQAAPDKLTGRPDGFAFTTFLPEGAGLADPLADAALVVTPEGLVLRWRPHPAGPALGLPAAARTEILLAGVTGLDVSYLAGQPNGSVAWSPIFSGGGLPLLIRLHLTLAGQKTWPDIVVAPPSPSS
jgi:general secretion pathway protein J